MEKVNIKETADNIRLTTEKNKRREEVKEYIREYKREIKEEPFFKENLEIALGLVYKKMKDSTHKDISIEEQELSSELIGKYNIDDIKRETCIYLEKKGFRIEYPNHDDEGEDEGYDSEILFYVSWQDAKNS